MAHTPYMLEGDNITELKPCPFCGDENPQSDYRATEDGFWELIVCSKCGVEMSVERINLFANLEEQAIKAWNTRTP